MDENKVEQLRKWLRLCPYLQKSSAFRVNYLGAEEVEYALTQVPSLIRYRRNVLGEEEPLSTQTEQFSLQLRLPYGKDIQENMRCTAWCQQILEWIIAQCQPQRYPEFRDGRVLSIVPTLSPYVAQAGQGTAGYEIMLQVTYERY